eukprot:CAMPEP_0117668568 /NCGR_PEP_ID=MMETSP0804-20121206/11624_1 /TAXON_ID=1074897 /ORGANISM="Tetraselmis astigmatica, Strain CCMP880" /LENGTH=377 /DNA_ID=CAMNT_0005476479 /DNA_START=169 /DNA_END=1302 /DNA_ORIENTATION=+
MSSSRDIRAHMAQTGLGKLPSLDSASLQKLKDQAMKKAKSLQEKAVQSTKQSFQVAQIAARDVASSKDAKEASQKIWSIWTTMDTSATAKGLGRFLVCMYFINIVYEDWETYSFMSSPEMAMRVKRFPERYPAPVFPYIELFFLLPCAFLAICGWRVPITGSILVLDMLKDSGLLIWNQTWMLIYYGQRPNELMVKRVAMLGCSALVLAHSVKDSKKLSSYAGMLLAEEDSKKHSSKRSLALLLGRVLMSFLFIYVGINQLKRVMLRDMALWSSDHARGGIVDGHDNNWLLLEFLLSMPFAIGFKTEVVSRLLAGTLALEALTCWPFWSSSWPTWHYAAHVRSHFVTNLAVSGGLLLLQGFGAGKYTVDELLKKKDT